MIKKILTLCLFLFASNCMLTNHKYLQKEPLKKHFKWLNPYIYNIILEKCNKYKVDPVLMCSVIQYESGTYCNNNLRKMLKVRSWAGAIGLAQIMPFHVKNPRDLYNPRINIEKGAWYLSLCIKRAKKLGYKNIYQEACRLYNSGVNAKRWKYRNWIYVKRICKKYRSVMSGDIYIAGL